LDPLEDACNYSTDNIKCFLVPDGIEAERGAESVLHLDQHDRLIGVSQFPNGGHAGFALEHLAFQNIRHVLEAHVYCVVYLVFAFRHDDVEIVVGVGHTFEDSSFMSEHVDRLGALDQEVDRFALEQAFQRRGDVGEELAAGLRLQYLPYGADVCDEIFYQRLGQGANLGASF